MRDLGIAANLRLQYGPFWKNVPFNKIFDPTLPQRTEELTREKILAMGFTPSISLMSPDGHARTGS
ncbi:hypothetical protein [Paracoccus simplex]|uniref:Uncharacterized protein n=1 Tax=Paracoccus simplex TaxID=2086346 RepID=A0ABV7RWY5_9RHOB